MAEIREIFVICEDLDWKGRPMEIVSPRFQGEDDSKEFAVIDVVVSFSGGE